MDAAFWHQRWANRQIGFHQASVNAQLIKFFPALRLAKGARVLVPLCGKTLDISWLLENGFSVIGAELSEDAVIQLFEGLGISPQIEEVNGLRRYFAANVEIYVGDFFLLSRDLLGGVDAVYDRAALVALPAEMRQKYARHLIQLTGRAPQLLICYEYDQSTVDGPPFSIDDAEVRRHYAEVYALTLLEILSVPGGMKGKTSAQEKAYLLAPP